MYAKDLVCTGITGSHLLTAIIDAAWKVNAYYNGVCMRRGDCYVCVIHFLSHWTVFLYHMFCFLIPGFLSSNKVEFAKSASLFSAKIYHVAID